jgi:hypothetical protein
VTEEIPDREILSACLDLLLSIASHQRGEAISVTLRTDKGTPINMFASNHDNCGLPARLEPVQAGQAKVDGLLE